MNLRPVAVVAFALAGCTWFDDGPPDRTCRSDRDCFRAQGEICNRTTLQCEPDLDGGVVDAGLEATVAPTRGAGSRRGTAHLGSRERTP